MDWTKEPPSKEELSSVGWDASPPSKDELQGHLSLPEDDSGKASKSQTALEHFGNGASFGYMPHLQAAAEKAGDAIGDAKDKALDIVGLDHLASIDHQLQQKGFKLPDSTYLDVRDHNIKRLKKEAEDNPVTAGLSNVAGGVATGIATGGLMPKAAAATALSRIRNAGQIGGIYGAAMNPGDKEGELAPLQLADRADNAAKGAALGGITAGAVEGAKQVPDALKNFAERSAVNATGATGVQASKFEDDAGRQLLDRGLVKFGDSPANVANRVSGAMDSASADIDGSLKSLDAKGVTASADKIVSNLQDKIKQLEKDPSQSGVVKKLRGIVDDIIQTGESNVPVGTAEKTKRGFNKMAGNWMDPEVGAAGKQAYLSYMDEVERAAKGADPALASKFKTGKETYGLLNPIEEAASKRASTVSQSPWGGLGDMVAAGSGGAAAGGPGAVAGVMAKKMLMPRLSSSAAVTADSASKFLMGMPKFAQLAESNPSAFQAAVQNLNRKVPSSGMKAAGSGARQDRVVSDEDAKQQFLEGN